MTAMTQPMLTPFGRRPGPLNTVVFHPAGGGLGQYVSLLSRLSRRGPVHGVRAMGLVPGEEPDRTVEAMAERCLGLIRELPVRPDLLVGWSLGGLLAWETGARLAEDGPAPAVVMIDSFAEPWSAYGSSRERLLDDILRGALVPLGPEAAEAAVRTAGAHLDACAVHHVTTRHQGPALLMPCAGPERGRQVADWRRRAPQLAVAPLDCGHFDVFGTGHTGTVLGHLDAFLDASVPVSGAHHPDPEGT
ncbi:hypothetical protein GCM10009837_85500 [Streptomyces durmitorensis]|uniref:Thioesterase domain-containing protein n=1 Tax=Streptomyces durmitorensis TaxID=319947 RepID=A0ABY4PLY8_9ACTN|nr:alpha/beta fold hydrolase [Streptomyces durmitorensis]UQT54812.1 thioesterase domain-containing protein [Streptomyces durmitorensis]